MEKCAPLRAGGVCWLDRGKKEKIGAWWITLPAIKTG